MKSAVGVAVGLFVIALLPRIFGLDIFITSDEPLWLTRSILFSEALGRGDWAGTLQTGHPGVTTMWTGSLGLGLAYLRQGLPVTFLEFLQTLPHQPERIEAALLPWMRLPTVLLAAAAVALIYGWGRKLVGDRIAVVGALLLAFDPLFLAHSRTLHHDALATIFMSLSLLALLNFSKTEKSGATGYLILSGVLTGLALLSKGTALALIALGGLFFGWLWLGRKRTFGAVSLAALVWLAAAAGVFTALWPAMWVIPGRVLSEVFGWVMVSTDVGDIAETTSFDWAGQMPELGVLFYPVNWLLKSTALSLVGLAALAGWWRVPQNKDRRWVVVWLFIFALLFTVMLTLGDKRDGRYLLPIYPGLWLLAAAGLTWLAGRILSLRILESRSQSKIRGAKAGLALIFALLLPAFSLPWYPYYHSYYNPLLGGSKLAPRLVKVGWGEGMEQVAAYLNQQADAPSLVVATSYASTFLPFFAGATVKHHQPAAADYVLNYVRQMQNGYPFPEYGEYYRSRSPLFEVRQDGLDYAWLYPGPHITVVRNAEFEDGLTLLGFVPEQAAAQPGQANWVTLLWRLPQTAAPQSVANHPVQLRLQDDAGRILAESNGPVLDPAGPSPVEGHFRLDLPPGAPRGDYELWVTLGDASHRAGTLPVRQLVKPPAQFAASANFGDLITFGGADIGVDALLAPSPEGDAGLRVDIKLLWQARRAIPQSYTTFVHAVDKTGQIWGQVDRLPGDGQRPTQTWDKGEWVVDAFPLTFRPDTPPGTYTLLVGVYDSQTLARLPLTGAGEGQTVVEITSIGVP